MGAASTPLMRQYLGTKDRYPDALLFFRLGDFYEMFFEDAVLASQVLELTLTSRNKGQEDEIPMCGVPHHAAHTYLARLLDKGFKVALCEQLEDPAKVGARGLVKRDVVRVVTPGIVLESDSLDAREPNYLAALCVPDGATTALGVAVLDLSTAEFRATEVPDLAALCAEVARLGPREVLIPEGREELGASIRSLVPRCAITIEPTASFDATAATRLVRDLAAAAVGPCALSAAAAALAYARSTQPGVELPVKRLVPYRIADHLVIDETTQGHLELLRTTSGEKKGSLLDRIDATVTAAGARLLRSELLYPLRDLGEIGRRHDRVAALVDHPEARRRLREALARVSDIERLASRAALGAATPRDLASLRDTLLEVPAIAAILGELPGGVSQELDSLPDLADSLGRALVDSPPISSREGAIFRSGWDAQIDELAELGTTGKDRLLELEARERERTGIASLKLRFNKVFGYYFEVTRANLKSVPADFIRKQTIAGGERFTTPELETLQSRILTADDRRRELEAERFRELSSAVGREVDRLRLLAGRLADIDVRASHAENAHRFEWVRPVLDEGDGLDVVDGRHPVVEAGTLPGGFVPNDVGMSVDGQRLLVITGPNMAGKSTYIRQVALAVLLAQMGSYVPARSARIGLCDRIFTRVGASDNLARGQSTFMVEMTETAAILSCATQKSLVVLDEIGRGTSTYDGLSIAWAVAEFIHDTICCKALFATHYHELVALADTRPHVAVFNVAAKERQGKLVFLRKVVPGGSSRSYGIEVARLAGLPEAVLARARAILRDLERGVLPGGGEKRAPVRQDPAQMALFATRPPRSPALEMLRGLAVDRLTPLDALNLLAQIRKAADDEPSES